MAINFCNESLDVKINCNQLSADNYSVNNLISNDPNIRRNGFRVEYYIRPPIEITFVSQIAIDLMFIEIGLKSNDHKTSGIEIYSSKTLENDFNLIVKHFTDSDVINVRNVCFRPNGKLSKVPMPQLPKDAEQVVVPSRQIKNCYQAKQIKLKIIKTTNSSVASISYLNIFGQPIRNTPQEAIEKIINSSVSVPKNVNQIKFYDKSQTEECVDNKKRTFTQMSSNESTLNSLRIPPEFIDLITNDIMVLPVLLPCGKSIDKSTLDKYLENESTWGRAPNDPFTCLPFTRDREPIPNDILKIRIDRFLSQNHEKIQTEDISSKRIAGYSSQPHNTNGLVMSRLVAQQEQQLPPPDSSKIKEDICSECKIVHKTEDTLYKLSCNHVICRSEWLKKLNDGQITKYCGLCERKISNNQIVKVQKLNPT